MAHDHGHASANRRRLIVALVITLVVLVAEVIGALLSGSLALAADAGHLASDAIGLVVALLASVVAARPATDRQTYGYRRAEVFGALINGVILTVVAVTVALEGVRRLVAAESDVEAPLMLAVAAFGLVANVICLLILRGGAGHSINMRGAYLEVFGDALGSVAALVAAVVILATGFAGADAIASLVIAAMIVPRAFLLLRDVLHVLSESAPPDTSVAEIRDHIRGIDGVVDVHDVHVWAITSGAPVFSAHVVVEARIFASGATGELLDQLGGCLTEHFDVEHSTFQLEPAEHAAHEEHNHR